MNSHNQKKRSEINISDKWNIDSMYPDKEAVLEDLNKGIAGATSLSEMQGHIMDDPRSLLNALITYSDSLRAIERAYSYTHMKRDEDNTDQSAADMFGKASAAFATFSSLTAFLDPEILEADPSKVYSYIEREHGLEMFRFMLTELIRQREHTLSKEEEYILALYSDVLRSFSSIFTALNNADMDFGTITSESGEELPLTHASYIRYLESDSRHLRRAAYEALYDKYISMSNTLTAVYSASVRKDSVSAGLRKFSSSLEAALFPDSIPLSVYDSLISAVHDHLPSMHKYTEIRRRVLGVDSLEMYDMYVPLASAVDTHYTFEQAVQLCCEALKPMGEEYVRTFRRGISEERWVDRYENAGKTSGAYSYGCYDSDPFILMSFGGTLRDVFTLIHEGGHSMHSWYTRNTQPYIYGDHSIFTAEVASTVNETLLIRYLIDNAESEEMQKYLINFYIDGFKGTLFRQTMFAEFEKSVHEYVESGGSLTSEWLSAEYGRLNSLYYGPAVSTDERISHEWSRIPHFYRAYYVYQYATGYSAANALVQRILTGGPEVRESYIEFLRSGSSDIPVRLLQKAGVDMCTPYPVESALCVFDELVDRLDDMTKGHHNA